MPNAASVAVIIITCLAIIALGIVLGVASLIKGAG
jgi:hypothetical protein